MKKTLLVLAGLFSASTFATQWTHDSYPAKKAYFHSVGAKDITETTTLEFSCSNIYGNLELVHLKGLGVMDKRMEVTIKPSVKDKISNRIHGELVRSEDGMYTLLTGEKHENLKEYFKKLHGVDFVIETTNGKKLVVFNLSGSSKNMNLFDSKCDKL